MSLYPRTTIAICWLFAALFCQAATINVGVISFDTFIPGATGAPGINVFTISNFTGDAKLGGFALPPDFPVRDSVVFQNSTLTLAGAHSGSVSLGNLGAGSYTPDALKFPDTTSFATATFTATLGSTHLTLADGTTFVADSPNINATLMPSSGSALAPGVDSALLQVSGTATTGPTGAVPEPATWLLCGSGLLVFLKRRRSA